MQKGQKILTGVLWGLTVLAMMSVIGAGLYRRQRDRDAAGYELPVTDNPVAKLDVIAPAPRFDLIDQNNQPLSLDSLKGHPFVADFVYTRCPGPCPIMTGKMASLQNSIGDARVHFLTVSVDPTYDQPAVLKAYAKTHNADESRWHFATGKEDAVFATARGMLIPAMPASETTPIVHSEKFILVDASGNIRGYYNSKDEVDVEKLVADAKTLAAEPAK
ncbi:MAG TPA: SCO family protein [Tepidisphaeraceae bacterium]|jgi:protein SCO1/2